MIEEQFRNYEFYKKDVLLQVRMPSSLKNKLFSISKKFGFNSTSALIRDMIKKYLEDKNGEA